MNKQQFMRLMKVPQEWEKWDMYPAELFNEQFKRYESGHEHASEHDRNGMFHWWLRRNPTKDQLKKLTSLTFLDPDELMAEDVRGYIRQAANFDKEVQRVLERELQQRVERS